MARRVNHEGTLSSYATPSGEIRYRIAYWVVRPDGEFVRRFRRGFETERAARETLADLQVDIRRGDARIRHEIQREIRVHAITARVRSVSASRPASASRNATAKLPGPEARSAASSPATL